MIIKDSLPEMKAHYLKEKATWYGVFDALEKSTCDSRLPWRKFFPCDRSSAGTLRG